MNNFKIDFAAACEMQTANVTYTICNLTINSIMAGFMQRNRRDDKSESPSLFTRIGSFFSRAPASRGQTQSSTEAAPVLTRTNPERGALFDATSQAEWQRRCLETERAIADMIARGATLLEVYEYARQSRNEIAQSLKHEPVEKFGQIRLPDDLGPNYDNYWPRRIAGSQQEDTTKFSQITGMLLPQLEGNFTVTVHTSGEVSPGAPYKIDTSYRPTTDHPLYVYESHTMRDESTMGVAIYSEHDLLREKDVIPELIKVRWPVMNEQVYSEGMKRMEESFRRMCASSPPELFALLAEFAYDMSRTIPLQRGTASVNEWIIRAVAGMHGIKLDQIRVNDLSFDIYAELQSDKRRYINDFVHAVMAIQRLDASVAASSQPVSPPPRDTSARTVRK